MTELSSRNFGLLIAYLIPGMVVVWAASFFSGTANSWLVVVPQQPPTVAGFLYLTLASTAGGVIVSAIRWATIDAIHHNTGVTQPKWDFAAYSEKRAAFDAVAEDHYRFYQFYANLFVALALLLIAQQITSTKTGAMTPEFVIGFIFVEVILFAGSRDALKKYYSRGTRLLGEIGMTSRRTESIGRGRLSRQITPRGTRVTRSPHASRIRKD